MQAEYTDALMMHDFDRLSVIFTEDGIRAPGPNEGLPAYADLENLRTGRVDRRPM